MKKRQKSHRIEERQKPYIEALNKAIKDLEENNMRIVIDWEEQKLKTINTAEMKNPTVIEETEADTLPQGSAIEMTGIMQELQCKPLYVNYDYRYLSEDKNIVKEALETNL